LDRDNFDDAVESSSLTSLRCIVTQPVPGDSAEAAHFFQSIGVLQAKHLDDCLAMPQTIAEDLEADIAYPCDLL
jgi:hypothetical protein